jgi:hypothetical protein
VLKLFCTDTHIRFPNQHKKNILCRGTSIDNSCTIWVQSRLVSEQNYQSILQGD